MTCHIGPGIAVCTATGAVKRVVRFCAYCKARKRGAFIDEGYYGARLLLSCGHSWTDGMDGWEFWPSYQGKVARRETSAHVAEVWKAKLPSWATQQRRLSRAMGFGA